MLNKETTQLSLGNGVTNQAGRDVNDYSTNTVINYNTPSTLNDFFIYEDDIKEIICFFNSNVSSLNDTPFPDNEPIEIEVKNNLNKLSHEYFENEIEEKSLPQFGRIRAFLKNPRNSDYVEMYENISEELQNIVLVKIKEYGEFDTIFSFLYSLISSKCSSDKAFMKLRRKIMLFLHFMYYNCDIGLKN
mgnify:CR=1 FL=1